MRTSDLAAIGFALFLATEFASAVPVGVVQHLGTLPAGTLSTGFGINSLLDASGIGTAVSLPTSAWFGVVGLVVAAIARCHLTRHRRSIRRFVISVGAFAVLVIAYQSALAGPVDIATARYSITNLGIGVYPSDINNGGRIVGTMTGPGGAVEFARLDPGGRRVTISTGGDQPYSILINNRSEIVGATTAGEGREYHVNPFRLSTSGQNVSFADTQLVAFVNGINDRGEVAARTWAGPIPYDWDNRAMIVRADGNHSLIDTLGGNNNDAVAINNAGVIVGSSELSDFSTHGFLHWRRRTAGGYRHARRPFYHCD